MCRNDLCVLYRAAVLKIGGDAGRSKRVTADLLGKTRPSCTPFYHPKRVVASHAAVSDAIMAVDGAEEGRLLLIADTSGLQISIKIFVSVVVGYRRAGTSCRLLPFS